MDMNNTNIGIENKIESDIHEINKHPLTDDCKKLIGKVRVLGKTFQSGQKALKKLNTERSQMQGELYSKQVEIDKATTSLKELRYEIENTLNAVRFLLQ